jgi:hypothetical protein
MAIDRMIGVFGEREMEIAAILIVDNYQPGQPINPDIFKHDFLAEVGFSHLQMYGWIKELIPTKNFWNKTKGR